MAAAFLVDGSRAIKANSSVMGLACIRQVYPSFRAVNKEGCPESQSVILTSSAYRFGILHDRALRSNAENGAGLWPFKEAL